MNDEIRHAIRMGVGSHSNDHVARILMTLASQETRPIYAAVLAEAAARLSGDTYMDVVRGWEGDNN